jgi:hypothetical protein
MTRWKDKLLLLAVIAVPICVVAVVRGILHGDWLRDSGWLLCCCVVTSIWAVSICQVCMLSVWAAIASSEASGRLSIPVAVFLLSLGYSRLYGEGGVPWWWSGDEPVAIQDMRWVVFLGAQFVVVFSAVLALRALPLRSDLLRSLIPARGSLQFTIRSLLVVTCAIAALLALSRMLGAYGWSLRSLVFLVRQAPWGCVARFAFVTVLAAWAILGSRFTWRRAAGATIAAFSLGFADVWLLPAWITDDIGEQVWWQVYAVAYTTHGALTAVTLLSMRACGCRLSPDGRAKGGWGSLGPGRKRTWGQAGIRD